jgi:hypothetical protein
LRPQIGKPEPTSQFASVFLILKSHKDVRDPIMPSLFRFLFVVAALGAAVYGGVYALAHFVQPTPREITVSIPPDKFFKNR